MSKSNIKDIMWRAYLVYFIMLGFGIAIIARLLYIQIAEGDFWRQKAMDETVMPVDIEATRGSIFADDGRVMATSVPIFDVRMDVASPNITDDIFKENIDSLAMCLANLFKDRDAKAYKTDLVKARKEKNHYFLIKRNVEFAQLKALKRFPIFNMGRYRGGLIVVQKDRREMPFRILAQRTIGFSRNFEIKQKKGKKTIKRDTSIYVGLEGSFNGQLQGVKGKKLVQRIANGVFMPLNDENIIEPKNGKDIVTTINIEYQDVAEMALMKQLRAQKADHGCAVLMEVATGEIKAIANLTRNRKDTSYSEYIEAYNYALGEATEPGSTFKLISLVAALDDGKTDLDAMVNTGNGITTYYNRDMKDVHGGYGTVTVKKAFEVSSNVGISKVIWNAYSKNPAQFVNKLREMQVDRPLNLEIAGEGMPQIKDPKRNLATWYGTTLPWMSIGYEVALTPLQILTFYNAIANGGTMVKPMLVKEIRENGNLVQSFSTKIIKQQICKKETVEKARQLLEGVVENGTAKHIKSPDYKIAGKTGTAQIAGAEGYNKSDYKASFVGYFPADNPMYSCIVVINNPRAGLIYGGTIAAPVFKEIADKVFATQPNVHPAKFKDTIIPFWPVVTLARAAETRQLYNQLGIPYIEKVAGDAWISTSLSSSKVITNPVDIRQRLMPNVTGMTAKDAVYLLESMGLKVTVKGKGKVKSQSKTPGSMIVNGESVILELSI